MFDDNDKLANGERSEESLATALVPGQVFGQLDPKAVPPPEWNNPGCGGGCCMLLFLLFVVFVVGSLSKGCN